MDSLKSAAISAATRALLTDTNMMASLQTAAMDSLNGLSEEAKRKIGEKMALFNQQYVYPHGFAPAAAPGAVAPAAAGGKSKTRKRAASRKRSRSRKSKSDK
jgi:hypothetical protein